MFDIAWSELLLIAVVALIFIGPKELPQVLNSLGRAAAKLRRSADDFRRRFEESMREAGYEDLHKNIQDFRSLHPGTQLRESIDRAISREYPGSHAPEPLGAVEQAAAQPAPGGRGEAGGTPEGPEQSLSVLETVSGGGTARQAREGPAPLDHRTAPLQKPADEPSNDRAVPAA